MFNQLSCSSELEDWPLSLYAFNPRVIRHFKKALGDEEKTDFKHATVIAERLHFGRDLPRAFDMDEHYLPLRSLTRYRYHLVRELVRVKSYTVSQLYLKATDYTQPHKQPFSDLFGATSQAVLLEFATMDAIAAMPFEDLVEWLDVKGKRRFPHPEANARKLQLVAKDAYRLPEEWVAVINDIIALNLRHITLLENLLQRVVAAITAQMEDIPQTLETIPGIGEAQIASYAGLKWPCSQSGDFQAQNTPLARTANRFLRYYLCEAAQVVRLHAPEYKAYYQRKYHEVRKHQHRRAVVLTSRKLTRLVVRLLTTNEPYRLRQAPGD